MQDYYVPVIKGAILCQTPDVNIVDLTHNIKNYDIVQAAFVLKHAYRHFPAGTIHVVCVNQADTATQRYLALKYGDYYFIGPDNGIFSMVFEEKPEQIFSLDLMQTGTFPHKTVIANAVAHILQQNSLDNIGIAEAEIIRRIAIQPVTGPNYIRGSVIHLDNYENVIININYFLFEKVRNNRSFGVFFKRHDPITVISRHYAEVAPGEALCLFNSADYLEIAINMGKAASMLGLKVDDNIQIEFYKD